MVVHSNIKKMIPPIDMILDDWIKDVLEPSIESNTSIDVLDEMNKIFFIRIFGSKTNKIEMNVLLIRSHKGLKNNVVYDEK